MKDIKTTTPLQTATLVILRLLIGWHLFYEGLAKLLNPEWSSAGFLSESKWILSGFASWVTGNVHVLQVVDFLNIWGLIAIGTALILGLFIRFSAIAGAALLMMYYLNNPPLIGLTYSLPAEGSYLIVNKTLIEAVALFILAIFPAHTAVGLEALVSGLLHRKKHQEEA
jgi:thiosulfate dehydrogenase [quinone] large subunit